jgi:two-component sensor histidine kinase
MKWEGLNLQDSIQVASIWFRTAVISMQRYLATQPHGPEIFEQFTVTLERSIVAKLCQAAAAYTGFLLNEKHEALTTERQQIARELHDRVGYGLTTIHRQLELHEIKRSVDEAQAATNLNNAIETAQNSIRELRSVLYEMHLNETPASLEGALWSYLSTIEEDGPDVSVSISGDESRVNSLIREESFMIIREAIRNALTHASPTRVIVRVDVTPHELWASVEDDGCGFNVYHSMEGIGLISMRERAKFLGGKLSICSATGAGTTVRLSAFLVLNSTPHTLGVIQPVRLPARLCFVQVLDPLRRRRRDLVLLIRQGTKVSRLCQVPAARARAQRVIVLGAIRLLPPRHRPGLPGCFPRFASRGSPGSTTVRGSHHPGIQGKRSRWRADRDQPDKDPGLSIPVSFALVGFRGA